MPDPEKVLIEDENVPYDGNPSDPRYLDWLAGKVIPTPVVIEADEQ